MHTSNHFHAADNCNSTALSIVPHVVHVMIQLASVPGINSIILVESDTL